MLIKNKTMLTFFIGNRCHAVNSRKHMLHSQP